MLKQNIYLGAKCVWVGHQLSDLPEYGLNIFYSPFLATVSCLPKLKDLKNKQRER